MMAHNNTEVVKTCLRLLDDERFTVFLLVDAKSPLQPEDFLPELRHACCEVLPRQQVNWAGYSMVDGTLALIDAAVHGGMDYLHMFQGADLPLKTPDQIDTFLQRNAGKNFINFQWGKEAFAAYKATYHHYFVDTPAYRTNKGLKALRYGLVSMEKLVRKPSKPYWHGSALFSITGAFAQYLLEQREEFDRDYRWGLACDEVFLQTALMESSFADTLYENGKGCRLIDWSRAEGNSPRIFTMQDREMLRQAMGEEDVLFARKFSETRDMEIVRNVEQILSQV